MNVEYTAELREVGLIPEQVGFSNIVKKIIWSITFFDSEDPENIFSVATIETYLNTESIDEEAFVAWENITQTEIVQFALEEMGGQSFVDDLKQNHVYTLDKMKLDNSLNKIDPAIIPEE